MIKIVIIKGGLGNQMFEFAFSLMISKKSNLSIILIDPLDSWFAHNGFEINNIFSAIRNRSYKYYRRQMKFYNFLLKKKLFKLIVEKEEDYGKFNSAYLNIKYPFLIYDGYWQSELYFKNFSETIRAKFKFSIEKLNESSKNILSQIDLSNSVSLHIRRGDYLNHNDYFGNICTLEYYNNAINLMNEKFQSLRYFVFSDDIEWAKENMVLENIFFVDCNKENDSWQDMCLMSKCKHNIIANSTFSWWGAWLNQNPEKTVISPKKWTNKLEVINLIPKDWIKI